MAFTRGNILDRVAKDLIGDESTKFRTYLATSLDHTLDRLWDLHDWNWKHKASSFTLTADVETVDLASIADFRSSQDIEVIWIPTKKKFLRKVDLRVIKKDYPGETNTSAEPNRYAPWGATTIFLDPIQTGNLTAELLYISKPVVPTTDATDLQATTGLPRFMNFLLEKMLFAEGLLYHDEDRYFRVEERIVLPNGRPGKWLAEAIQSDMKHLEETARFKFWEEEMLPLGITFDDFLRKTWWGDN